MKKVVLSVVAAIAVSAAAPAFAADMPAKAPKVGSGSAAEPVGHRLRRRHHERLHLPRCDPIGAQAVGRGIFRAALQHQFELAALCRHLRREHQVRQQRGGRNRLLRRCPPDLRSARLRFRLLVLLLPGWPVLRPRPAAGPGLLAASTAAFRRTATSPSRLPASTKSTARSPTPGPIGPSARTSIIRRTS